MINNNVIMLITLMQIQMLIELSLSLIHQKEYAGQRDIFYSLRHNSSLFIGYFGFVAAHESTLVF